MTCKDCIHYPICQRFTELGYSITEERKDLEVHCKFFEERPRWHYELPAEDNRDTLLLVISGNSMIGEERFTLKTPLSLAATWGTAHGSSKTIRKSTMRQCSAGHRRCTRRVSDERNSFQG